MLHSKHAPSRLASFAGISAIVLLVSACSVIGRGGPRYDLRGSWDGSVTAEGQRIPGTLAIDQDGRVIDASFLAPEFDLMAEGSGEVDDEGAIWMELAYDLQCPGTAMLEGNVSEDTNTLSGSLSATDCTGTVTGSFRFSR